MKGVDHRLESTPARTTSKSNLFSALCVLLLVYSVHCLGCRPKPPDLANCSGLQVNYPDKALGYFLPSSDLESILSDEEREYICSFETHLVTDQHLRACKELTYTISVSDELYSSTRHERHPA
jgi:hypothetical protein